MSYGLIHYSLTHKPAKLNDDLIDLLKSLSDYLLEDNLMAAASVYNKIIGFYGTHAIKEANLGNRW